VTTQFVIGSKILSTIATATPQGILCWEVFEGTISDEQFIEFVNKRVRPLLAIDTVCILDNARYHHTDEARGHLEQIFNGQYAYSSAYSPWLKPVEKAFALIKAWLREHEVGAMNNPVLWINRAFEQFQIGSPRAGSLLGYWNLYFTMRTIFEQENA
jgi:hypothetical protein